MKAFIEMDLYRTLKTDSFFYLCTKIALKPLFEFDPLVNSEGFDFPFNIHVIPTTFTILALEGCF